MFKCSFKLDEKVQKELNKNIWLTAIICAIVGAAVLCVYIISVVFHFAKYFVDFLPIGMFLLVFGGLMLFIVYRTNSISVKRNLFEELEINEDHLVEKISKNNEVVATNKFYFKDFTKIKETKNFLFLYMNVSGAVPISKNAFSNEDFAKIKALINNARYKK